jgi:RHS repeat-associated protein
MEVLSYDAAGRKEGVTRVTVNTSGVTIPIGKTLENAGVGAVSKSYAYTKYASNVVYNNTHISEILLPGGMLKRTNALTTNPPVFSYYYYVNDHLGNVRTVIDGSGTIKQVNNYYPFGMEYGESSENQSMMTFQNYQFGGKEFDRKYELNLYDFGARFYDATRGQWTTPDPLTEKYYSISPYVYCANNPMKFVDPDGRAIWIYY